MINEIYLDNSATTKPYDDVVEYVAKVSRDFYGNPSSLHTKGIKSENLVKKARTQIAESLKVDSKDICFTSGGTESNNLAILGYLKANPRAGKHVITSEIEHPSVLEVYKQLALEGYIVDFIPVDNKGVIRLDVLKDTVSDDTSIISIIHTNNETGSVQPIEEICNLRNKLCPKAVIHIDAVQAFGKTLINPSTCNIDLMSISSHKIHGPKGVGGLYIRKGLRLKPVLIGGGQESTLRSGTENVPGICGFGLATEIIFSKLDDNYKRTNELRNHFVKRINETFAESVVNSPDSASPYIINVSFPNLKSEVLLHHLEQRNIFVSTGSACSSRKTHHSHVLKAMGVSSKYIDGAIRFSLSHTNNVSEMDETIEALKEIIPIISIKRGGKR
ncbi:cysteine desulfurase family protein [Ruminiclostridium cellulolyticum]|uniref:Aminotransferase class V n=1 Tax=Ruminiclostridium cellulolyticum (strain ATCC 35319 / DSM 5812 / JCM 6584 / H10) TaxID=394503 RepID=B8I2P2_RUMCH|nr:cysteine desulfurase family protein [Ruminiclostridium cellulolyticum]ACL76035.1 aminotransferase class V [Ruminiclostridium cellulolyticum H10]